MTSEPLVGVSQSLNNDSITVKTIRDFIDNRSKPAKLKPIDLLYLTHLMVRKAEDHGITDSNLTLSQKLNCDLKTIVRSRERLVKAGYITAERRKGRSSAVSINTANVPAEATLRSKLTPAAKSIAAKYQTLLRRLGKKKFPKYFFDNQVPSAQRILDSCGGNETLAASIIEFAVKSSVHRRFARKSLYELFRRWQKVKSAFDATNAVAPVPIAVIEPTPPVPIPPVEPIAAPPPSQRNLKWEKDAFKYADDLNGPDVSFDEVDRRAETFGLEVWGSTFLKRDTGTEVPLEEAVPLFESYEERKAA
jgi:hypothetical protein